MAWGDVDGDGDLDLAAGNGLEQSFFIDGSNKVYLNNNGILQTTPFWQSNDFDETYSIAWGDVDGDGDLDLAAGNGGLSGSGASNKLYLNQNGILQAMAFWQSDDIDWTSSIAWGDVDNDSDLDLAVGNTLIFDSVCDCYVEGSGRNKLYLNQSGMLLTSPTWQSDDSDGTSSVAWGDVDADGDLDLAVGNNGGPNKLYLNQNGTLQTIAYWQSDDENATTSIAWGDVDADGDLDLAVGNNGGPNKLYLNQNGILQTNADNPWRSGDADLTQSIAWKDVDGDGDLDLAVGNWAQPNKLYLNLNGVLQTQGQHLWASNDADSTSSIAWGDIDGDGDPDLAVGNWDNVSDLDGPNKLYLNGGPESLLPNISTIMSIRRPITPAITSGYVPGQRITDIHIPLTYTVFASQGQPIGYIDVSFSPNGAGQWFPSASTTDTFTQNLATQHQIINANSLPLIDGGLISSTINLSHIGRLIDPEMTLTISHTQNSQLSAALVSPWPTPNGTTIQLFDQLSNPSAGFANLTLRDRSRQPIHEASAFITNTVLMPIATYTSTNVPQVLPISSTDTITSFLITSTLIITDGPTRVEDVNLINLRGMHTNFGNLEIVLQSPNGTQVRMVTQNCAVDFIVIFPQDNFSLSWDDEATYDLLYNSCAINDGEIYQPEQPLAKFDGENSNGTWTLVIKDVFTTADGGMLENWGLHFNQLETITTTFPIYGSYHPLEALSMLNGIPADTPLTLVITDSLADGQTGSLVQWSVQSAVEHVYTWDTFASGFFGQSENMVIRMIAYPHADVSVLNGTFIYPNLTPGPFQWPHISAQTFPFRIRGTQVRVMSGTQAMSQALVYRLEEGQIRGAEPYRLDTADLARTDNDGYLQGRGQLKPGDQLFAMLPISHTKNYIVYFTSGRPLTNGVQMTPVTQAGIQTVTVSVDKPLMLFDLTVSLEWDASQDETYINQLTFDLQRASELVYDWTNGQIAFGKIQVYQDQQHWNEADIRVYASNQLRPNAFLGGILETAIADTDDINTTYVPGQINMSATWNRYGDGNGTVNEDWAHALAHEFGHYALFLQDSYLGLDEANRLIQIEGCDGTAMTDPYRDDFSEFLNQPQFAADEDCQQTLAALSTRRADWQTISTFYPWLSAEPNNDGPSLLPLNFTQISFIEPLSSANVLESPNFFLSQNGVKVQPGPQARAFLFQPDQARLIDLGTSRLDQVKARGARLGDRLCLYESRSILSATSRLGCETITLGDDQLALVDRPDWQPQMIVSPVVSDTIDLIVPEAGLGTLSDEAILQVQIYPANAPASQVVTLGYDSITKQYIGTVTLAEGDIAGYVHLWISGPNEPTPRREIVTSYALGGTPAPRMCTPQHEDGDSGIPATSTDGQAILSRPGRDFLAGEFFALQAATSLPDPPPGRTIIGQAQWVLRSQGAPTLDDGLTSLSFQYLGQNVPPGEENGLEIYYLDESQSNPSWQRLETNQSTIYNIASTTTVGEGLYALMSSIKIPLVAGWQLIAYPIQETTPVSQALQSIDSAYNLVYSFDVDQPDDPWQIHCACDDEPNWPAQFNDLTHLEFGQGYWIQATEAISFYASSGSNQNRPATFPNPPAIYFGEVSEALTTTVGATIDAWIDNQLCGTGQTVLVEGQLLYRVKVLSDGPNDSTGCGSLNKSVRLTLNNKTIIEAVPWNNGQVNYWPLPPNRAYLPLILKN